MATKGITTPIGTFEYPKFFKPDTKFDEDGIFSGPITVPLDDPKSQELIRQLESAWQENLESTAKDAVKKGKSPKIKECEDKPWTVNSEANTLTIRAKKKAQFKNKDGELVKTKVPVFGPDLKPMTDPGYLLGTGSIGRMSFSISPFYQAKIGAGISLRLEGVQILEMKQWERTGESLGFDAVEQAEQSAAEDGEGAPPAATSGTKDF